MTGCNHGWTGRILHIDLSSSKSWVEPTADYADRFLGGKGINQAILLEETPAGTGPFDPENRVIVGTGPLTGTLAPSCGRVTIGSMNAFNGGVAEANSGGHLGPEIKYAGFDHVVIHGQAERPVYLWIHDDDVDIKAARRRPKSQ